LLVWDYRPYWHLTPLFSPANFAGEPENIFGNTCSFNLLCVPRERGVVVEAMQEITSLAGARMPAGDRQANHRASGGHRQGVGRRVPARNRRPPMRRMTAYCARNRPSLLAMA